MCVCTISCAQFAMMTATIFPSVPVKPLDSSKVWYRKNLCWIVEQCGAKFILCNDPFHGQDKYTVDSLKKMMESIPVEWLCEGHPELIEEGQVLEGHVLDMSSPADVAFLQYTTTGEEAGCT